MTYPVAVIVPAYRAPEKLARCLAHLRTQSYANLEIFTRDNSYDNVHFTAAVNEGLRKFCYDGQYRYAMLLNQDSFLAPDAIERLAEFLDANPQTGIAAPIQHTSQGRVTWGGSLRAFPFGEHRCDPLESYTRPSETYWANGAAMMLRTDVVREVGLWDRNLRFICSDVDFSFTARARGWKIHVVPAARCEHDLSSSSGAGSAELDILKLRDAIYLAHKWVTGDLYRALSYEGPSLTRLGVRNQVDGLQRLLARLEQHQRGMQPSEPLSVIHANAHGGDMPDVD